MREFTITDNNERNVKLSVDLNKSTAIVVEKDLMYPDYYWDIEVSFNNIRNWSKYQKIFSIKDEYSAFSELPNVIDECILKQKEVSLHSDGSVDWYLSYGDMSDARLQNCDIEDYVEFKVFNNFTDLGVRFQLNLLDVEEFKDFLITLNEELYKKCYGRHKKSTSLA